MFDFKLIMKLSLQHSATPFSSVTVALRGWEGVAGHDIRERRCPAFHCRLKYRTRIMNSYPFTPINVPSMSSLLHQLLARRGNEKSVRRQVSILATVLMPSAPSKRSRRMRDKWTLWVARSVRCPSMAVFQSGYCFLLTPVRRSMLWSSFLMIWPRLFFKFLQNSVPNSIPTTRTTATG